MPKVDIDGNLHSDDSGKFVAKDGSTIESERVDRAWSEKMTPQVAIKSLIADERHAVEMYEKAIAYFQKIGGRDNTTKQLDFIKNEELRHIDILKKLL